MVNSVFLLILLGLPLLLLKLSDLISSCKYSLRATTKNGTCIAMDALSLHMPYLLNIDCNIASEILVTIYNFVE
uniref:Uncharacterized protein n=1 Tax=Anguilla anguilla TaxID=7936 RepID=A0A0E9TTW0_ANGAN